MKHFVKELEWRGMIHDIMPGTEEELMKGPAAAYVGIDPTGDSLHIGHLVSIMILKHFQACGHKPYALVGGATGMIGDPSMKSQERNLLDEETLAHNVACIKAQLGKFLDFESSAPNKAELVNNYDWMKDYTFINFTRDIGKLITVNYMMAKDSVRKRLSRESNEGMSFTEFTYQLLQGYDFLYLYEHNGVKLQLGGADQWGNITTGTELIRRKLGGEAYALTCPLITKADGGKFGKTEKGNIWLDPAKTSPYDFYQFWLNCSDEDSKKYIRIFTLYTKEEIEAMEKEHEAAPHLRILQKALAKDLTIRVHSEADYNAAVSASEILFGKGTAEELSALSESMFLSVFEGVAQTTVARDVIANGIPIIDLLADTTKMLSSKGDARRELKGNGISVNKTKVNETFVANADCLINGKYILLQKGKKNYHIVKVE